MAISFPDLCPVRRSFSTGDFPTKRFQAVNGAGVTRLYGSKAFNATLDLEYLANDSQVDEILSNWANAKGTYEQLRLAYDNSVFDGMDPNVFPNYLIWRWAEAPSVSSVMPQLSRVTVKLIATLEA